MNTKHTPGAHLIAFGIGLLSIIMTSIGWIMNLKAGPRLDGFTGGAMVIYLPFMLFIFSIIWLVVRAVLKKYAILTMWSVLLSSAISSYLMVFVICGPTACFANINSQRRIGYFLIGGAIIFALVHQLVLFFFQNLK